MAEVLDYVDDFLHDWHGDIVVENYENFHISRDLDGINAVTKYFTSRNLEPPPTYDHDYFVKPDLSQILFISSSFRMVIILKFFVIFLQK
ncbi:MAG: hypothetical protein ACFFAE_11960 [Candidatus Hodarchaeota archaeon]